MVAWKDYETAVKINRTLLNVLNKEHDKQIKDNWEYMKTIAEVLLLTATQNIAQRGHDVMFNAKWLKKVTKNTCKSMLICFLQELYVEST